MIRILCALMFVGAVVLIAIGVVNLYDSTLQAGRMWETPAVKPHEQILPVPDGRSIAVETAEALYRKSAPDVLKAPFDLADASVVAAGRQGYRYYCIQCHGPDHDGYGTVGQSFAPKPGDLRSARIQDLPEGRLFHEISYGIPGGRQPPLATTIAVDERWQIIGFIKSLGVRP